MNGGSDSSGQPPGNQPPEPPWGAVPPWERGGPQSPPPQQPPEPSEDNQDTDALDRPEPADETVFADQEPGGQEPTGAEQGGDTARFPAIPPDEEPPAGDAVGETAGEKHVPAIPPDELGGEERHIPAIPPEEAGGEQHFPAIPPEELAATEGEQHFPAIPPEELAATGGDPYQAPGPQGPYGNQPPPLGGVQGPYGPGGPQGPGGFGPPPPQPPPPSGGGGSKVPLVVALIVAGVLVLGGMTAGGVALVRSTNDPSPTPSTSSTSPTPGPTLSTPSAASTTPTASALPLPQRINERSHDATPLSLKELFPSTYKGENGYNYKRYTSKLYESCSPGVEGSSLRSALKKGKCSQIAAATYVDSKHKVVITIGLANMTDLSASKRVDAVVRPPKDIVFKPLDGKSPAKFGGKSYYQWSEPVGHYVRWSAATYTNRSPTRTESFERLTVANGDMNDLINVPLSLRMLKAKP